MTKLSGDEIYEKFKDTQMKFSTFYKNEFDFFAIVTVDNKAYQIQCLFSGSESEMYEWGTIDSVMKLNELHKIINDWKLYNRMNIMRREDMDKKRT